MSWWRALSTTARLIVAIAALALFAWLGWRLFGAPRFWARQAAEAKVDAAQAKGTAAAAEQSVRILVDHGREIQRIETITRENDRAIHAAPGAGDPIGVELDRAGRAALCMRSAYRDQPACQPLPADPEGLGAARPDDGRRPPL